MRAKLVSQHLHLLLLESQGGAGRQMLEKGFRPCATHAFPNSRVGTLDARARRLLNRDLRNVFEAIQVGL
jgi:hypothetical protein